jgi:hydrogenase expression/formation protein HypC
VCLGIPGQVVEKLDGYAGQLALVEVEGAHRRVNIGMLEDQDLEPGDWVIVHMGFALERVDQAGAEQVLAGLELGRPQDDWESYDRS